MATHNNNSGNSLILALETSGRMGSVALAQGEQLLGEREFSGPTRPGVGANLAEEVIDAPIVSSTTERIKTSGRSQMRHSAEVFPAIVDLLGQFGKKPNQIEQVCISVGPGSFTGLRIAVTIAKTMALANGSKIVAVDTLDVIAANVNPRDIPERLAVILDAKRGQFFIAVYEETQAPGPKTQDAIWQKILPDCLMTADEFLDKFTDTEKPIALIGEGLVYYKDKFKHPAVSVLDEKYWNPTAANVYRLGWEMAKQNQFADPLTLTPNYLRGPDVHLAG